MCGRSKMALNAVEAEPNETLGISSVGVGGFHGKVGEIAGFHRPGESIADCVICVQDGMMLTIGNIPSKLQRSLGLEATAVARFVETAVEHHEDLLVFENGKEVQLKAFADKRVTVFVGVLETKKVADIDPVNCVPASGPAIRSRSQVLETREQHREFA
jgi:hypothetical protein